MAKFEATDWEVNPDLDEEDKAVWSNWVNGNFSDLDRHELIGIARHFEDKLKECRELSKYFSHEALKKVV